MAMEQHRELLHEVRDALTLHVVIAFVSPVVIIVITSLSRWLFGEAVGLLNVIGDAALYREYACQAAAGAIPYRDFTVEYPVLAIPFILLPRLFYRLLGEFGTN